MAIYTTWDQHTATFFVPRSGKLLPFYDSHASDRSKTKQKASKFLDDQ